MEPYQVLSSLPDSFTGNSRAPEIVVDPSGRALYASNRGLDTVATFRIEPGIGRLSFVEAIPSQGKTPRFIALSPSGDTLFVLNEDSDSIVTLSVDRTNARLAPVGEPVVCGSPVCMVFAPGSRRS